MGFNSWVRDKGVWYLIVVVAAYGVAWFFDVVPQPVKDLVGWFDRNTSSIFIVVCFLAACFVVLRLTGKKKKGE